MPDALDFDPGIHMRQNLLRVRLRGKPNAKEDAVQKSAVR